VIQLFHARCRFFSCTSASDGAKVSCVTLLLFIQFYLVESLGFFLLVYAYFRTFLESRRSSHWRIMSPSNLSSSTCKITYSFCSQTSKTTSWNSNFGEVIGSVTFVFTQQKHIVVWPRSLSNVTMICIITPINKIATELRRNI